jgi:penicillin-binding protein 1A
VRRIVGPSVPSSVRTARSDASRRTPTSGLRTAGRSGAGRRKKGPSALGWLLRIAIGLGVTALLLCAAFGGTIAYYSQDLPDVRSLRNLREPETTRVVDRNGELLGELFEERRTVMPLERIPRVLVLSVLAAEDADFYRHEGFDTWGLARAIGRGILNGGEFRGTSTITQQVVKNLLLTSERSLSRKIRELILARELEAEFTKDEILGLYLNHINFGHGRYGVYEAAHFYFGCEPEELTLAQASLLAGIPQSPTHLSPRTHPEAARRRQRYVLDQLEDKREEYWPDLSLEDIRAAREAPVELAPWPEATQAAPEVVEVARRTLAELVGEEEARRGGYVVHTSLDAELQRRTRAALREGLESYDERHEIRAPFRRPRPRHASDRPPRLETVAELRVGGTYDAVVVGRDDATGLVTLDLSGHSATASLADLDRYNPEHLSATRFVEDGARLRASVLSLARTGEDGTTDPIRARLELGPEGAAVVLDPRTREVLALVGGYETMAGFDRATLALRQPGSTFKPIVYAWGIHSRALTPATIMIDAPGVYDAWQPQNYETWEFRGEMRLRDALAASVNQVAVRAIETLGPEPVAAFARQLGITSPLDPTLALALGASEVRPIELCNAYATFAAGGRFSPWQVLTRIERTDGSEVALPPREPPSDPMTPAEAYVVTSLLRSVIESPTGTARAARSLGRVVAGKTGTSNEARDVWFAGYSADLVSVVWVGYDDHRTLGRRESGARTALPIWSAIMRAGHEGRAPADFALPSGVVTVRIDPASGLLAYDGQEDAIDEVFLEGTEPHEVARERGVLGTPEFLMNQFDEQDEPTPGEPSEPSEGPEPAPSGTEAPTP